MTEPIVIGDAVLHLGDCLEVMRGMEADSIDAIVTDPPYALSFMGKQWDGELPSIEIWKEALRVAKPGAHLLAAGAPRTHHRLMCALEDAGWEIRDVIMHVFGQGFPKNADVSKMLDKKFKAEREVVGISKRQPAGFIRHGRTDEQVFNGTDKNKIPAQITSPATEAAKRWAGFGTSLKPAFEPWILCRKPLIGTIAENVIRHGTGGINIDQSRVSGEPSPSIERRNCAAPGKSVGATGWETPARPPSYNEQRHGEILGRWPSNLIHDNSNEVVSLFPNSVSHRGKPIYRNVSHWGSNGKSKGLRIDDSGSAARFFKSCEYTEDDFVDFKRLVYQAKASRRDRNEGCNKLQPRDAGYYAQDEWSRQNMGNTPDAVRNLSHNHHPSVKPTALMQYLVRLITPKCGVCLDPFMGSGSTGKAALLEGFRFIGIEREVEYFPIAEARIRHVSPNAVKPVERDSCASSNHESPSVQEKLF